MKNEYEYMDEALNLFKIRKGSSRPNESQLAYQGLLYPSTLFHAYGRPSVHFEVLVALTPTQGEYQAFAHIVSIDDSGCSMWGCQ